MLNKYSKKESNFGLELIEITDEYKNRAKQLLIEIEVLEFSVLY